MPDCFVIMPISTSKDAAGDYGGDDLHFAHVLDHLFVPAIERAGLEVVKPIIKGADLIHAEIVKQLEEADMVLCDMSGLNANVFFELGIRTALDRPAALVKDDKTGQVPFDASVINHHTYDSSLSPWKLEKEIQTLSEHLSETSQRAGGRNGLWRYFGLTQRAEPAEIENPLEEKIDLVLEEVAAIKSSRGRPASADIGTEKILQLPEVPPDTEGIKDIAPRLDEGLVKALADVVLYLGSLFIKPRLLAAEGSNVVLDLGPYIILESQRREAVKVGLDAGLSVTLVGGKTPNP
jgi:hypothetical protein